MRPEELYKKADDALKRRSWEEATAFATVGLLGMLIGGAKAVEALGVATEYTQ